MSISLNMQYALYRFIGNYFQKNSHSCESISDTDFSVTLLSLAEFIFPKSFLSLQMYFTIENCKSIMQVAQKHRSAKKCHSDGGLLHGQLSPLLLLFLLLSSISLIFKIAGGYHLMHLAITVAKLSSSW